MAKHAAEYAAAEALMDRYRDEHPDFPMCDWACEMANGGTRLGYWMWLVYKLEAESRYSEISEAVYS